MIRPKLFPKVRICNTFKIGYTAYWHNWKSIKYNITPTIQKFWKGQIIHIGFPGIYLSLDFRRGDVIKQMMADSIVRDLPKN